MAPHVATPSVVADRSNLAPAAVQKRSYDVNYATHFKDECDVLRAGSVYTQGYVHGAAAGAAPKRRTLVDPSSQLANTARVALAPLAPSVFVVVIADKNGRGVDKFAK